MATRLAGVHISSPTLDVGRYRSRGRLSLRACEVWRTRRVVQYYDINSRLALATPSALLPANLSTADLVVPQVLSHTAVAPGALL